jgi:hypothetical protein
MSDISLFTAVSYGNNEKTNTQSMLEKCDDFFFLRGRKAFVLPGRMENGKQAVVLSEARTSLLRSAVKVMLYFTVFLPVLVLALKLILRAFYSFSVLDPKKELEEGLNVTKDMKDKVQALLPQILTVTISSNGIRRTRVSKTHPDCIWLGAFTFIHKDHPDIIFKAEHPGILNANECTEEFFDHMLTAKATIMAHNLGLLVLPQATKFNVSLDGKPYAFIAMQRLKFVDNVSAQEKIYHDQAPQLNETVRQLATLVVNSNLGHDALPYFPKLEEEDMQKPRVAVTHLHQLLDPSFGIRALIRCASREQIDIILAEAQKAGIEIDTVGIKQEIERRERFIQHYEDLHKFYDKKGIVHGFEPLNVNYDDLGLDLTEEAEVTLVEGCDADQEPIKTLRKVTLRQVAEIVVEAINVKIHDSSPEGSIKGGRRVILDCNGPIYFYQRVGISNNSKMTVEEERKARWIDRIIDALVAKGHIFSFDDYSGHGYFIQA